jgi:hypothetical protein
MNQGDETDQAVIVLIHRGDGFFLTDTVRQICISNPHAAVWLIGDASNAHYPSVSHVNMSEYFNSATRFAGIYKHLNTNGFDYELLNFQRWFVLLEFLEAKRISRCLYIDSDVLLYADARAELDALRDFDLTLHRRGDDHVLGPHCCYIPRLEGLQQFVSFVTEMYSKPELLALSQEHFERCLSRGPDAGGAGDMSVFYQFDRTGRARIQYGDEVRNGTVYDSNINESAGFEMAGPIKAVFWRQGVPYFKTVHGDYVRCMALHFQGHAKRHMHRYVQTSTPFYAWRRASAKNLDRVFRKGSRVGLALLRRLKVKR